MVILELLGEAAIVESLEYLERRGRPDAGLRRRSALSAGKRSRIRRLRRGARGGCAGRRPGLTVIVARGDVVGAVGVEEGGDRLDLIASHAEFELAAAVEFYAGGLGALDAVQQRR